MKRLKAIQNWLRWFTWDSKDQEQGYGAFVKWASEHNVDDEVRPIDLFFIQKDHESQQWFVEVMGNQVRQLQDEISRLDHELAQLKCLLVENRNAERRTTAEGAQVPGEHWR